MRSYGRQARLDVCVFDRGQKLELIHRGTNGRQGRLWITSMILHVLSHQAVENRKPCWAQRSLAHKNATQTL